MNLEQIALAAGKPAPPNMISVHEGMRFYGFDLPHRIAHFLCQVMHESAGFKHDREIWGPTKAQLRYEGRLDLGNTEPGDGRRYSGRTPIQITGRTNYRQFTAWARQRFGEAPDFEADPDAVLTDPWEGLAPIWFWETRGLDALADQNAIEAITRRINGGLNGYADRRRYYARTALVMLGRKPTDVRGFQESVGLRVDGISGQLTEAALHKALVALPAFGRGGGVMTTDARLAALEARVATLEAA